MEYYFVRSPWDPGPWHCASPPSAACPDGLSAPDVYVECCRYVHCIMYIHTYKVPSKACNISI